MKTPETAAPGSAPAPATDTATATPGKQTLTGGAELLEGVAKVEGPAVFSGNDGTIQAGTPPDAAPKKDVPNPAKTDEQYETAFNVKKAIDDGTMKPVANVNGKSFTATGCAGKPDGKVTFTFDRAFIGEYLYPAAGKNVKGAHVIMSVKLENCGEHTDVKLVQVLRDFKKGGGGAMETKDPSGATRKTRAGSNDAAAKSKGWYVDGNDDDTTPFFVSSDLYGQHGSSTKPARLRDTPGDWATSTNCGSEFRTSAVSYKDGKGTVLACIEWGYYVDAAGKVSFYPNPPVAHVGATTEVKDAAARWDAIPGMTKANLQ